MSSFEAINFSPIATTSPMSVEFVGISKAVKPIIIDTNAIILTLAHSNAISINQGAPRYKWQQLWCPYWAPGDSSSTLRASALPTPSSWCSWCLKPTEGLSPRWKLWRYRFRLPQMFTAKILFSHQNCPLQNPTNKHLYLSTQQNCPHSRLKQMSK